MTVERARKSLARGLMAAGAALSLAFGAPAQDEPPTLPVADDPQPAEVGDWPTPDNFQEEHEARATGNNPFLDTGNNPFLDLCQADRCIGVTRAPETRGDLAGRSVACATEYFWAGASPAFANWYWGNGGQGPLLVAAVYQDGERIASDSRTLELSGPVEENGAARDTSSWVFEPLSDQDWIQEVFVGGQSPFTASTDNPDATSARDPMADLEGADYAPGSDLADFDNPHETPGSRGAVADFIGQDYVVGYPGSGERVLFEVDPAAFADGEAPQSLGDALIAELTFDPGKSGRIGVLALAPRAVRGAQPIISPSADASGLEGYFQSFGLVVSLRPRSRD